MLAPTAPVSLTRDTKNMMPISKEITMEMLLRYWNLDICKTLEASPKAELNN